MDGKILYGPAGDEDLAGILPVEQQKNDAHARIRFSSAAPSGTQAAGEQDDRGWAGAACADQIVAAGACALSFRKPERTGSKSNRQRKRNVADASGCGLVVNAILRGATGRN